MENAAMGQTNIRADPGGTWYFGPRDHFLEEALFFGGAFWGGAVSGAAGVAVAAVDDAAGLAGWGAQV
jgi:hypothetical protein